MGNSHSSTLPNLEPTLFDQAHARKTDPITSKQAAASVTNLGPTRDRIINILYSYGPLTDEQIWKRYQESLEIEEMKLSQAALLGRTLFRAEACPKSPDGGCILTMAAAAMGAKSATGRNLWHEAKNIWPWLLDSATRCPAVKCYAAPGVLTRWEEIIFHLFDSHVMDDCGDKWTIEQLADYIASIEPEEHDGTTLTKLELAVRYAEMNAGIERSSDSETADEMDAAVSQGFRP